MTFEPVGSTVPKKKRKLIMEEFIYEDSELTWEQKGIISFLARLQGLKPSCYPSYKYIAKNLGMTPGRVQYAIAGRLEKDADGKKSRTGKPLKERPDLINIVFRHKSSHIYTVLYRVRQTQRHLRALENEKNDAKLVSMPKQPHKIKDYNASGNS